MEIIGSIIELLLVVAGVIGLLIALFFWPKTIDGSPTTSGARRGVGVFSLLFILFFLFTSSIKVVGAGEIGVVKHFGAVESNTRGPGINFVIPFFTDIVNVDGRVQGINFEKIAAASSEYQDVFLTGTLNVHVDPAKAADLYQTVGLDYKEKLVVPFYTNIVKEVVPQFGIAQILPKRDVIRQQTVERLRAKLSPYGIIVDDVALSNVDFNENYNAAIQDKQIQELKIQTEKNILQQKQIQADQAKIEAQGLANAAIEKARGQAEANRLISQSLNQTILLNNYIDKLSPNLRVMMVPNGQNFLLDLKNLVSDNATN